MMHVIAENLRRRWRLPWQRRAVRAAPKMQPWRHATAENSADVLEEIWRTADRRRAKANLFRRFRRALAFMRADLFGACLCCNATLGRSRLTAAPWAALCMPCQDAANRDDAEVLRIRSRG
jgi:RNA polymerase-binding transcription factor DksA